MQCRFCGKWSGLFDKQHEDCFQAHENGQPIPGTGPAQPPGPVTSKSIFWAVFAALCAFAVLVMIVGSILKALAI
jgi:hypothetical protein